MRILNPLAASNIEDCDKGKVESALAAPAAGLGEVDKYPSLAEKAAALLYAFAKGHCCPNGNKRLAYVLTAAFVLRNEHMLWADPDELSLKVEQVAASQADEADKVRAELAEWIGPRLLPDVEAHVRLHAGIQLGGQPE